MFGSHSAGSPFPPRLPAITIAGMSDADEIPPPDRDLRAIAASIIALCGAVIIAGRSEEFFLQLGFLLLVIGIFALVWQVRLRRPKK